MNKSRFYLLGNFHYICASGSVGTITSSREVAVIAILARSNDYSCARSKIIDLLWSDRCGEQGRATLRHTLWSLKKTLGNDNPGLLQIDRRRVRLNAEACIVDTQTFTNLAASPGQEDLQQAVSIYRGELVEALSINDREWETWLGIERTRLEMKYAQCLQSLGSHYRARGDVRNLLNTGLQLIEHNPLWEEGHRVLMEAYTLAHQKSMALKQYEAYRDLVYRELHSHPEARLQQLYELIKNGRADTCREFMANRAD
jgi:DNA-binding SARP family transcriptional activator